MKKNSDTCTISMPTKQWAALKDLIERQLDLPLKGVEPIGEETIRINKAWTEDEDELLLKICHEFILSSAADELKRALDKAFSTRTAHGYFNRINRLGHTLVRSMAVGSMRKDNKEAANAIGLPSKQVNKKNSLDLCALTNARDILYALIIKPGRPAS